jgi:hypothetical protein
MTPKYCIRSPEKEVQQVIYQNANLWPQWEYILGNLLNLVTRRVLQARYRRQSGRDTSTQSGLNSSGLGAQRPRLCSIPIYLDIVDSTILNRLPPSGDVPANPGTNSLSQSLADKNSLPSEYLRRWTSLRVFRPISSPMVSRRFST